jgi:hypothetical protein
MSSIFGDRLGCHEERESEKVYAKHRLHEKYGAFQSRNAELIPGNRFKTWDYLHLDGSLDWLQPVDDATAIKMADTLVTRPAANEDTMRIFEEAVDGYATRIYGYPNDWYVLAQDRSI